RERHVHAEVVRLLDDRAPAALQRLVLRVVRDDVPAVRVAVALSARLQHLAVVLDVPSVRLVEADDADLAEHHLPEPYRDGVAIAEVPRRVDREIRIVREVANAPLAIRTVDPRAVDRADDRGIERAVVLLF